MRTINTVMNSHLSVVLLISYLRYFSATGQISTCAIGRSSSLQNSLQVSTSEAWQLLDLNHPALCDGEIAGLLYCYSSITGTSQQSSQVNVRIWRRFVKNMSTLHIINEFALQLSTVGSGTHTICSNASLKEPVKFEHGDVIGFLIPTNFGVGQASVDDVPTEGLYRDKRSVEDYNSQITPRYDLLQTNLTLNVQIKILPSVVSSVLSLTSTSPSMVQSSLQKTTSIAILSRTTSPQPTMVLNSDALDTSGLLGGDTSIMLAPSPTNPSTVHESLADSVKLQITPSTFLNDNPMLNTLSQSGYDNLSLQPLQSSMGSSTFVITNNESHQPTSILGTTSSIINGLSMDSNLLRLSSTLVLNTAISSTYADNSRQLNAPTDVIFSNAATSNRVDASNTEVLSVTASPLSMLIGVFDSTSMTAISRISAYLSVEITPINMMSLSEPPVGTTLSPSQTIQDSPLSQSTHDIPPSFSKLFTSSIKQRVMTLDPDSILTSPIEANTIISPLNTATTTMRIAATSILSLIPAQSNFPPSQTPIIVVQPGPKNMSSSILGWAVATSILFAIVSGCIMLITFYIFRYQRMSKMHVISANGTTLGVDNLSYSVKSSYKRGSIVPILTDVSTNELTVSYDSNNGSNDNVRRNSPSMTASSQQRPNHLRLPRDHDTSTIPGCNSFETEVPREKELDSIPLLLVSFSQSNCGKFSASEMGNERRYSAQSRPGHDCEELKMEKSKEQKESHQNEEPRSNLPHIHPASDYEKPISQNWKRLSMPRLSMLSKDDERSLSLCETQRRNSSACDLTMHCCTTPPSNPANKKPQKIRHYAEFSLYALQQLTADSSSTTKQIASCNQDHSFSFVGETQCHDYEQPFSHLPAGDQPLYQVPAPLVTRRRASDYEVPIVASPLQTTPSSMHSPVEKNESFAPTINIDNKEETKEGKDQDGEKREEESFVDADHDTNAKVCFNLDTSNALFMAPTDHVCSPENHDSVRSCPAMDGTYLSTPSNEEDLTSKIKKLSVMIIPYTDIERSMTSDETEQQAVWKDDQNGCTNVKIKSANFTNSDKLDVLREITIMAQFRHPNIVKLHGAVNESRHTILVSEHFPRGDLRKVLIQIGRRLTPVNTPQLLLLYSQQAALGMQYLTCKGFVHRDLSAASVFVTNSDVCKVGGFDKSRDLSNVNHHIANGGKVQVWSIAPEAVHHSQYSTASDVWSYGCLLYDIWSLGRMPFWDHSNAEVIDKVDSGYRLPPPPGCPLVIYNLMMQCWNPNPLSRPCFDDIIRTLLEDEDQVLKIPVKDASMHKSAIILGADLTSGASMYPVIQEKYVKRLHADEGSSFKEHDYDDIQEEMFMFAFPTSTADLASESKSSTILRKDSNELSTVSGGLSLVPQPALYSEPVVLSPISTK